MTVVRHSFRFAALVACVLCACGGIAEPLRTVAAGERVIGADIAVGGSGPSVDLSPRQREVLESVTRGLSNAAIAQQLGISPSAVKLYLSAVFEKLGATSRAEAVALALKRQLLKL